MRKNTTRSVSSKPSARCSACDAAFSSGASDANAAQPRAVPQAAAAAHSARDAAAARGRLDEHAFEKQDGRRAATVHVIVPDGDFGEADRREDARRRGDEARVARGRVELPRDVARMLDVVRVRPQRAAKLPPCGGVARLRGANLEKRGGVRQVDAPAARAASTACATRSTNSRSTLMIASRLPSGMSTISRCVTSCVVHAR
ncbi:hypothetical protein BURPS1710b_A1798 [Burkholderia pseudomallei 1710b]|uniref:Uncharacterized protein n=1 Tax=Burkholderia pseudomallei (strain 1710b) TaxID=320372 RepID=Q3JHJ8_BURP1|nr:hypothetical protein BURPS1710b_A1798 [Burkholderia pseudomallei 1710b]